MSFPNDCRMATGTRGRHFGKPDHCTLPRSTNREDVTRKDLFGVSRAALANGKLPVCAGAYTADRTEFTEVTRALTGNRNSFVSTNFLTLSLLAGIVYTATPIDGTSMTMRSFFVVAFAVVMYWSRRGRCEPSSLYDNRVATSRTRRG